jgi:hypothetical protein
MFNVRSYGVTGAGSDETAISAAATAAAASSGGILHFPPGTYVTSPGSTLTIPANVQVFFDEGATLEPNGASVTVEGRILAHPPRDNVAVLTYPKRRGRAVHERRVRR